MRYFLVENKKIKINSDWQYEQPAYIKSIERLVDTMDQVENEKLKQKLIGQVIKCQELLAQDCEKIFTKMYLKGYGNAIYRIKKKK